MLAHNCILFREGMRLRMVNGVSLVSLLVERSAPASNFADNIVMTV